jgi:hypothetical protein
MYKRGDFVFNYSGIENVEITTKRVWDEFKDELIIKKFNYKDIRDAKRYIFINTLDNALKYERNLERLTLLLRNVDCEFNLCRGTILGKIEVEDKHNISYDRFIPKEEYIKDDNRFSPAGVEYLYLGIINKNIDYSENNLSSIEELCLNEIRAGKNSEIALCNFKINDNSYNKKVVDLSIVQNKTFEDLQTELDIYCNERFKRFKKYKNINKIEEIKRILLEFYLKFITNELFTPIITDDRKNQYAPFHCLAQYFISLGYDGIIYPSTVYNSGKGLVLFNKNDAHGIGKIEFVFNGKKVFV